MPVKVPSVRVRARGGILVLDEQYARESGGLRGYIGRRSVSAWNVNELPEGEPFHENIPEFLEPGEKPIPHTAYPKSGVVEVDATPYVRKMLRVGALWPADRESADIVGVPFDPTFGGEVEMPKPLRKTRPEE